MKALVEGLIATRSVAGAFDEAAEVEGTVVGENALEDEGAGGQ